MKARTRIILLSVISILIVVTIVLGVTYSFMQANIDTSSVTEVSLSSCAKITLSDTGASINLNNTNPISKNRALQTTPYTFTVTSSCDNGVGFNIYLATLNTNTLDASNIHYIITKQGSKDILTEGILSDATNALAEFTSDDQNQLNIGINGTFGTIYKVYSYGIQSGEKDDYDLYLYVDSEVTDASTMGKTFNAGIAIKSYDYEFATINDVTTSNITTDSITLTVNAVAGENAIAKYYFSNNGGTSYVESTNNTYTFSELEPETEYSITVYVVDSIGNASGVYTLQNKILTGSENYLIITDELENSTLLLNGIDISNRINERIVYNVGDVLKYVHTQACSTRRINIYDKNNLLVKELNDDDGYSFPETTLDGTERYIQEKVSGFCEPI